MAVKQRTPFKPPAQPSAYTFRQLEELWIGAGGSRTSAPYAAAIALAESKGNPTEEGHNTNGTVDRGLWQINSVHGNLSTTDVAANAKAAVQIWNEGKGSFAPWVTFKTGAYRAYLTPQNLKSSIKQGESIEPMSVLSAGILKESKAEEGAEKALEDAAKFSWPQLGEFAVTAVLLLAGAVLVVYGIMVAVRPRESALSLPKMPIPVPV